MAKGEERRISRMEYSILQLLAANGNESMYGLQLVEKSGGEVKRGSVYVFLNQLEEKGFVTGQKEDPKEVPVPRKLYRITAPGRRAMNAWDEVVKLVGMRGAFA